MAILVDTFGEPEAAPESSELTVVRQDTELVVLRGAAEALRVPLGSDVEVEAVADLLSAKGYRAQAGTVRRILSDSRRPR